MSALSPMRIFAVIAVVMAGAGALGFSLGRLSVAPAKSDRESLGESPPPSRPASDAAKSASPAWTGDADRMGQFLAVLQGGSREELMASLRQVVADPALPPHLAGICRDALAGRLAQLGAARELAAMKEFPARDHDAIVAAVVRALAVMDTSAAEEILGQLPPGAERKNATTAFLAALGESDPRRGLAWIEAHPEAKDCAGALFFAWAKAEPRAAAEAAFGSGEAYRPVVKFSPIMTWAVADPDASWQWIQSLPPADRPVAQEAYFRALISDDPSRALDAMAGKPELSDSFMAQWIGLLIATDPKSADAAINRLPPGRGRTALISGIAMSLAGDPEAAIAWTDTLLPGEREVALGAMFDALGQIDPETALNLAAERLDGPLRRKALSSIISGWSQQDFDAAFAAMTRKLDAATLREALPDVFRFHVFSSEEDVAKMIERISSLDSGTRSTVWRAWGESQGTRGNDLLLSLVSRLPAADQEAIAEGAIQRVFHLNPKATAQFAGMLSPAKQAQHARVIARALSQTNLQSAADFLIKLPGGGQAGSQRAAALELARQWAYLEPGGAAVFAGSFPPGETRDEVSRAVAMEMRHFDLDRATQITAGVAGPKARNSLITELARAWARTDPERGRALMRPLLHSSEEWKSASSLFDPK